MTVKTSSRIPGRIFPADEPLAIETGASYLYGVMEERSRIVRSRISGSGCKFVEIIEHETGVASVAEFGSRLDFRRADNVAGLVSSMSYGVVYLDITGLSHEVWAPLLLHLMKSGRHVKVVYAEPKTYAESPNPVGGELFDLSEKIEGISPLPGFVNFDDHEEREIPFVLFLGFEGARSGFVLEHVQPDPDMIFPVVGVPGFRLDYPFKTIQGNFKSLEASRSLRNVRYATANCPFEAYDLLCELLGKHAFMKVAPIGTKPHALGVILFAIKNPEAIEIVYDHPRRKPGRSSGAARTLVYDFSYV